uniref:BLOC-1 related complex subunit 8 n=1 Tax=Equus caballus TaxID=9796 RepID=A0A9L0SB62_HORSE
MEEPEMQLKGKKVTDKFTESIYVLANEPSVALYRLQEHVRRSLPELAQHKADMQRWEEQSQGAIYTVEYACSAVKNLVDSSVYFRSVEGLLKQAISIRDHMNAATQGHRTREAGLDLLYKLRWTFMHLPTWPASCLEEKCPAQAQVIQRPPLAAGVDGQQIRAPHLPGHSDWFEMGV